MTGQWIHCPVIYFLQYSLYYQWYRNRYND